MTFLLDHLFLSSSTELILLLIIVFIASIARGAIGFGFSALVVSSTSFWLPPIAVINLTIILEVIASLMMIHTVRGSIQYHLLIPLAGGTAVASILGVWSLANMDDAWLQVVITCYLVLICLLSMINIQFKPNPSTIRLAIVGLIAGFFNGLAAIGGVLIALFLNGSRTSVANIRATMVLYFLISEAAFLSSSIYNDLYSNDILYTSLVVTLPMFLGITLGTKLFNYLSDDKLRQLVLGALIVISLIGLTKTLS